MDDVLKRRIVDKLEGLPEDKVLQVLDYIAFLESQYNLSERSQSTFDRLVTGVENTLRAGRVPVAAFKGTMTAMDAAGRVMRGLSAAGRVVADEIKGSAAPPTPAAEKPAGETSGA